MNGRALIAALLASMGCSSGESAARTDTGTARPGPERSPIAEGGAARPAGSTPDSAAERDSAPAPVTSLAQIQRGTPANWLVYELSGRPYDLHADADGVYWVQDSGQVYRGSKDGRRAPEVIGEFISNAGNGFASDSRHLYWLTFDQLRRVAKAGGEVEQIELPWDHTGGDITIDERYVYLAMWGCAAITRIDKQTLQQERMTIELERAGTGRTTLRLHGEEIFCGSWNSIFAVRAFGEPARPLVSDAVMISGMAVIEQEVYWIDRNGEAGNVLFIGRVPRAGGKAEIFRPGGQIGWGTYGFAERPGGSDLHFIADNWIASFSLETKRYSVHALDFPAGYLEVDGDFLYYTNVRGPASLKRMPLDHPPIYTLP